MLNGLIFASRFDMGYHDLSASVCISAFQIVYLLSCGHPSGKFDFVSCAQPKMLGCWDVGCCWMLLDAVGKLGKQEAEVWCLERRAFRELVIRSFSKIGGVAVAMKLFGMLQDVKP